MNSKFYSLACTFFCYIVQIRAVCVLDVSSDFGSDSPLLLSADGRSIEYPPRRVARSLSYAKKEEAVRVSCPCSTVKILDKPTREDNLLLACKAGTTFTALNREYKFVNITCSKEPCSLTRVAGNCRNGSVVEIGFQVQRDVFIKSIDLCFNGEVGQTYWAHATIPGASAGRQTIGQEHGFRVAGHFKNIPVANAYTKNSQRQRLFDILGQDQELVETYIPKSGEHYLARGHLIARADKFYKPEQASTFYYLNVLPMWQSVNNGNWKTVEENVRDLAGQSGDIEVWSGGLRVLQLTDARGKRRPIYLARNSATGKPAVPVPGILFKIAYSRPRNAAIVYLTANNPFLRDRREYKVCREYEKCRKANPTFNKIDKGITYCCLYGDFLKGEGVASLGLPDLGNVGALL